MVLMYEDNLGSQDFSITHHRGKVFENYVKNQVTQSLRNFYDINEQVDVISTDDVFDSVFTPECVKQQKQKAPRAFYGIIDDSYGDITIFKNGKPQIRLSCKSTTGSTVTAKASHLSLFCEPENSIPCYFVIAKVNDEGTPIGEVLTLDAVAVGNIFALNGVKNESNANKMWVGLQHLILADGVIHGLDNFIFHISSMLEK